MYKELCEKEGFRVFTDKETNKQMVEAFGEVYKLRHPLDIYFKQYRVEKNPDRKYFAMKKCHDYLWPHHKKTWNYWTERRFKYHCGDYEFISYAGGASTAKSYDAAKINLLFWLADPTHRGVVVASTTLKSLEGRIWGYITKLIKEVKVPVPYFYKSSPSPSITFSKMDEVKTRGEAKDTLHGMLAIAAGSGGGSDAIKNWIGRHPDNGLLVTLDEGTDMPIDILDSTANLDTAQGSFQLMIIGNSFSRFDLHGMLSTPLVGWDKLNPLVDTVWQTTKRKGVCLFFSCYESPAIWEEDPIRKEALSRFFLTQEKLDIKKIDPGEESDNFWRFVLGYWRNSSVDPVVMTEQFLHDYPIGEKAEFSGVYPLTVLGGLDLSFATEGQGDNCILRLGYLGVDVHSNVVLDLRGERLVFRIPIMVNTGVGAEIQIADGVIDILEEHNCPLDNICFDGSGAGRAMGATLMLRYKERKGRESNPMRVFSVKHGIQQKLQEANTFVKSHFELWDAIRPFIQKYQIKGMDSIAKLQFTTRLVVTNPKTMRQGLEEKPKYKKRMSGILPELARSPDEADALSLCVQAAIIKFGWFAGQKKDMGGYSGERGEVDFRSMITSLQEHNRIKQEVAIQGPVAKRELKSSFSGSVESLVKYRRF